MRILYKRVKIAACVALLLLFVLPVVLVKIAIWLAKEQYYATFVRRENQAMHRRIAQFLRDEAYL